MPENSRATITPLDGVNFQKEFPPWVTTPSKNISTNNMKKEFKHVSPPRENVYYETLKPIFCVLTLAGVLPVYKVKFGNHKLQVVLVGGVCLTMYLIFAYFSYKVTLIFIHLIFHDDNFNSIIVEVVAIMFLMQHVFYLVLTWTESLVVHKYLMEWKQFQARFEHVCKCKLTLSCRLKIIMGISLCFVMSGGYMRLHYLFYPSSVFGITTYAVLGYHLFILECFYILWYSNSWAVTEAAEQYNDHLSQECMLDITPEKLEEYRLLWMKLTEIVRSGSSMLSYTMAVMLATPFAYEVIGAYNLTMYVIESIQGGYFEKIAEALLTLVMFLFYGILIYLFCNSGHHMTVKCEQIQDILLTHKPRSPSNTAKVNGELRLFMRCLRSVPPSASLSGYVTVNRKVFLHLSGVLVTYLIILVQFNIGSLNNKKPVTVKPEKPVN